MAALAKFGENKYGMTVYGMTEFVTKNGDIMDWQQNSFLRERANGHHLMI